MSWIPVKEVPFNRSLRLGDQVRFMDDDAVFTVVRHEGVVCWRSPGGYSDPINPEELYPARMFFREEKWEFRPGSCQLRERRESK